jgi:methionyl-tRNA synthetase
MKRMSIDIAEFAPAFGIDMAGAGPLGPGAPQAAWGRIAPGGRTVLHRHDEAESFVILSGQGEVETDTGRVPVSQGDILAFEPFERHVLENTGKDVLVFADLYWRTPAEAARAAATAAAPHAASGRPVFVFSTPPTPNGDLHIGHLSGPYLGADVYTRFQKLNGVEAYHLTGSDDFQSYVVGRARDEGRAPQDVAAHYAGEIRATLALMDIHLDQFTITQAASGYVEGAQAFFGRATAHDSVAMADLPALFDGDTGAYLYEVDVSGGCPGCGAPCGGNICEECGAPNICADMRAPVSRLSHAAPVARPAARWAIDLGAAAASVRGHQADTRVPPRIRALTEAVLHTGPRIPVTHPADWGIRPDGTGDQVIWVWPEMAYGFLYGIEALGQRAGRAWDKAAPSDDWKIVHFFGYDNSFYHAILYPALYAAANPEWTPDIDYHVNEFYLLDGLKFSTSRRHAIWGKEILSPETVDAVRLFLSLTPEVERTNFSRAAFEAFRDGVLVEGWQGWLNGLGAIVSEEFGGTGPDAGTWSIEHRAYLAELERQRVAVTAALGADGFSLNRAVRLLCDLVEGARHFSTASAHLRGLAGERDAWRTAVALQLAAARLLACCAAPVAPRFGNALSGALGLGEVTAWPGAPELIAPGTGIALAGATFFGAGPAVGAGTLAAE